MSIIIAAAVGAFAAILGSVIPMLIKSRADRIAAEKEREEIRNSEFAQLQEKWLERDIEKIEAAVDALTRSLRELAHLAKNESRLKLLEEKGEVTSAYVAQELSELENDRREVDKQMRQLLVLGIRRAHSLGPEIQTHYMGFENVVGRLQKAMLGQNDENQPELWGEVWIRGGALQEALRNRILATRQ